jgi:hypothetical protein
MSDMPDKTLKRFLAIFLVLSVFPLFAPAAEIPCIWTGVDRIVAVGDLHGDCENFVLILKGTGMVDDDLRWTGGKTHLVQTGDILDRGTEAKKILDLLMRLEKEAEAAGGMVHVLLGNHEEMNITGISLGYPNDVTVEQFISFLPEDFRKEKEKEYIAGLPAEARARAESEGLDLTANEVRLYWQKLRSKDRGAQDAYIRGFNDTYGKWLLQQNAVIKINDIVFAHAGISSNFSSWRLQDINSTLRRELEFFRGGRRRAQTAPRNFRPKIVYVPDSPLWFRGLAVTDGEAAPEGEVNRILADLGARVLVVGHTFSRSGGSSPIVPDLSNISRYHGKVYVIDTGISHFYGGVPSALLINNGDINIWEPGGITLATASPVVTPSEEGPASNPEIEKFLRAAKVVRIKKVSLPGRTEPWKVTLEEGGVTRQAIFKYINRPRPELLPDSWRYERAAYILSRYLNLSYVPPVVEREIEGMPGSLQVFVEGTIPEVEQKRQGIQPADPNAFDQAMSELQVFESLVYDSCHNDEDTLIHKETWKIYRVDFAQAFEPNKGTPRDCEIRRCSKRLYLKLRVWDDTRIASLLASYLNQDEIQALNDRAGLIAWTLKTQIDSKGEGAVLF